MLNISAWILGRAINDQLCVLASATQTPVEPVVHCLANIVSLVPDVEWHLQPGLTALLPVAEEQRLCRYLQQLGRMMQLMEGSEWRGFYRCANKLMRLVRRTDAWARLRGRFNSGESAPDHHPALEREVAPAERLLTDGEIHRQLLSLASRLAGRECGCPSNAVGTVLLQFAAAAAHSANGADFCCHCVTVSGGGCDGGKRLVAHEMQTVSSAAEADAVIKESAFRFHELGGDNKRKQAVQRRQRRLRRQSQELGKLKQEVRKQLIASLRLEQEAFSGTEQQLEKNEPEGQLCEKHSQIRVFQSNMHVSGAKEQQILVISSPTEIVQVFQPDDAQPIIDLNSATQAEELGESGKLETPLKADQFPNEGQEKDVPEQNALPEQQKATEYAQSEVVVLSQDSDSKIEEIVDEKQCQLQSPTLIQSQLLTEPPLQALHNQSYSPKQKLQMHRTIERIASVSDISSLYDIAIPCDYPWNQFDSVRGVHLVYCRPTGGSIVEEDTALANLLLTSVTALQCATLASASQPDLASTKTQTTSCESLDGYKNSAVNEDSDTIANKLAIREGVNRLRSFRMPDDQLIARKKEDKKAGQVQRDHQRSDRVRDHGKADHRQLSVSARINNNPNGPLEAQHSQAGKQRTKTKLTGKDKLKSKESSVQGGIKSGAKKLDEKASEKITVVTETRRRDGEKIRPASTKPPKHSRKLSHSDKPAQLDPDARAAKAPRRIQQVVLAHYDGQEQLKTDSRTNSRTNSKDKESGRLRQYKFFSKDTEKPTISAELAIMSVGKYPRNPPRTNGTKAVRDPLPRTPSRLTCSPSAPSRDFANYMSAMTNKIVSATSNSESTAVPNGLTVDLEPEMDRTFDKDL